MAGAERYRLDREPHPLEVSAVLKTPPYGYYISGYDENHRFGIEFDGLYIGGKKVKSLEAFKRLPNVTIQHADVIIR